MTNSIQKTPDKLRSQLDGVVIPSTILNHIKTKEINKTVRRVVLDTGERIEEATQEYKRGMLMQEYSQQVKLTQLVDFTNWPEYSIGAYASNKGVITSEWIKSFLLSYAPVKKITDESTIKRAGHALQELLRANLIVSRHVHGTDSKSLGSLHDCL